MKNESSQLRIVEHLNAKFVFSENGGIKITIMKIGEVFLLLQGTIFDDVYGTMHPILTSSGLGYIKDDEL